LPRAALDARGSARQKSGAPRSSRRAVLAAIDRIENHGTRKILQLQRELDEMRQMLRQLQE